MNCTFCGDPAAHEATGCRYGPSTLACRACVLACWTWVKQHTNAKAKRKGRGVTTALSFYEAAGKSTDEREGVSFRKACGNALPILASPRVADLRSCMGPSSMLTESS